ncbi:MAG: TetR/AcrR family transcriptional regulator [Halioglobus sp.]
MAKVATAAVKGVGRPKGSNREASLAKILPAARRLFAERGYSNTTFKDVGKAVGMTHAALYSYFPSKAALYLATTGDAQAILQPKYLKAIQNGANFKQRLREILRVAAQAHEQDSSISGLLMAIPLEISRHPELAELMLGRQNSTLDLLADVFAQAQARGEIKSKAQPEELVVAIIGSWVGITMFHFGLQRTDLGKTLEVFIEMIEGSLFHE